MYLLCLAIIIFWSCASLKYYEYFSDVLTSLYSTFNYECESISFYLLISYGPIISIKIVYWKNMPNFISALCQ